MSSSCHRPNSPSVPQPSKSPPPPPPSLRPTPLPPSLSIDQNWGKLSMTRLHGATISSTQMTLTKKVSTTAAFLVAIILSSVRGLLTYLLTPTLCDSLIRPQPPSWSISFDGQTIEIAFQGERTTIGDFFAQTSKTAEGAVLRARFIPPMATVIQSCFAGGNVSTAWNTFLKYSALYVVLDETPYRWESLEYCLVPGGGVCCQLHLAFGIWDGTVKTYTLTTAIVLDSHGKWIPEDKRWSNIAIARVFQQKPIVASILSKGTLKVTVKDIGECVVSCGSRGRAGFNVPIHSIRVYRARPSDELVCFDDVEELKISDEVPAECQRFRDVLVEKLIVIDNSLKPPANKDWTHFLNDYFRSYSPKVIINFNQIRTASFSSSNSDSDPDCDSDIIKEWMNPHAQTILIQNPKKAECQEAINFLSVERYNIIIVATDPTHVLSWLPACAVGYLRSGEVKEEEKQMEGDEVGVQENKGEEVEGEKLEEYDMLE